MMLLPFWLLEDVIKNEMFVPYMASRCTIGIAVVASTAGYIPAMRASRVDAMQALRYE